MNVEFILLDPRPASLSAEQEKLRKFTNDGVPIVGVEVTIPALAGLCHVNIDPQHGAGGDHNMSAIAHVLQHGIDLIPRGAKKVVFATVRPDLDSFGAIALLWWELQAPYSVQQHSSAAMRSRIEAIHLADTFAHGEWQPRELGTGEDSFLAAIARCVNDFKLPMRSRIEAVQRWLETGEEPSGYRAAYELEQGEISSALNSGEITVDLSERYGYPADGKVVVVQSRHRAGTTMGYTQAPVVVALNPALEFRGVMTRKFTICQYRTGYVDLVKVKDELASLEAGWGGSPTIIGSPQGVDCNLPLETVVAIVVKHLI